MKKIFGIVLVHAAGLWLSLVVAYNAYKHISRPYTGLLPSDIKGDIKQSILWAIAVFTILLLISVLGKKKDFNPPSFHYLFILVLHTALINIIFFNRSVHTIIVVNAGEVVFVFGLLVFYGYKYLQGRALEGPVYLAVRQKPSVLFVAVFMFMLFLSALVLMFRAKNAAEVLADIAYFSLIIGVGTELYYQIAKNEKAL